MIEIDKGSIFAGRYVVTQDAASAQSVTLKIEMVEGSRCKFYGIYCGPDDYATAHAVSTWLIDENDNRLRKFGGSNIDDQQYAVVPAVLEGTSSTVDGVGPPIWPYPLSYGDYILVETGNIDQTETLTVTLRAMIYSMMPIVTAPVSDTSLTKTYAKVI